MINENKYVQYSKKNQENKGLALKEWNGRKTIKNKGFEKKSEIRRN